jgi:hypothetical protein
MSRPITHTVLGGFCTVCGDTVEWLRENGHTVVEVTNPAGLGI